MQTKIGNDNRAAIRGMLLAAVLIFGALVITIPSAFTDAYAAGNGNSNSNGNANSNSNNANNGNNQSNNSNSQSNNGNNNSNSNSNNESQGNSNQDNEHKTIICHYPPGDPTNPVTIEVADSSVQTHIDHHGDYLGECKVEEQSSNETQSNESQSEETQSNESQSNEQSESENNSQNSNSQNNNNETQESEDNKVTICHTPQGNSANPVTIEVAESSVSAHEAHGDYVGKCIVEEQIESQSNDSQSEESQTNESENNEEQTESENNESQNDNQSESENNSQDNEETNEETFQASNSESNESSEENYYEVGRGGALSYDITPPTTNRISFTSIQGGIPTQDFGGRLAAYSNDIPTQIMNTGVEQRLQVNVYDNNGIDAIKRVVVNMFYDYLETQKADTYFMYQEDGQKLTVSDPFGFFGDVKVYRTYTETEMVLVFVFTPQKPMPITDLVINAEDEYRNNQNTIVFGAFEIQGESLTSEETITAAAVIPYYKNPAWNQFVIDADGNMLTYDSFGNLDTNPARINDESVVYGSYIGKSERHDDGFWSKVAAEKERAQGVFDSKFPQKSFDSQVIKSDKVFKYPSNVGKSDRADVKTMSDLKQKEHNKASIVAQKIA